MSELEPNKLIKAAGGIVWQDDPGGKKILLVHRARYDDWVLPKGKLRANEDWIDAARREVEEETGYKVKVSGFAGCLNYLAGQAPKVVLFWLMVPASANSFQPSEEVDRFQWLPVREAINKLSYREEGRLVMETVGGSKTENSQRIRVRDWLKSLLSLYSGRRLENALPMQIQEIEHLIELCKKEKKSVEPWGSAARTALKQVEQSLGENNFDQGWRSFLLSQRLEIYGRSQLSPKWLHTQAGVVLNEAEEKLSSWRKKSVEQLLQDKGALKPAISEEELYSATLILHDHFSNEYSKIQHRRLQIIVLIAIAVIAAAGIIFFSPPFQYLANSASISTIQNPTDSVNASAGQKPSDSVGVPILAISMMFGMLGACLGGIRSLTAAAKRSLPEVISSNWITFSRPIVGAIAALAIVAYLYSPFSLELFQNDQGGISYGLIFFLSFASGFSESLVIKAVEKLSN